MTGPVVPPGGEELREAIGSGLCRLPRVWTGDFGPYEIADAVLPTVLAAMEAEAKRRAAEELRAAADLVARAPGVKHQGGAVHALRTRAAALQPHAVPRAFVTGDVVPASDVVTGGSRTARAAALAPENARPE